MASGLSSATRPTLKPAAAIHTPTSVARWAEPRCYWARTRGIDTAAPLSRAPGTAVKPSRVAVSTMTTHQAITVLVVEAGLSRSRLRLPLANHRPNANFQHNRTILLMNCILGHLKKFLSVYRRRQGESPANATSLLPTDCSNPQDRSLQNLMS